MRNPRQLQGGFLTWILCFSPIVTLQQSSRAAVAGNNGKIVFDSNRDSGNAQIYVMNADGSNQTRLRLTNSSLADFDAVWSPDGTKIAFVSLRDGNFEIYVMNADGSGQTRLTHNAAQDVRPSWQALDIQGIASTPIPTFSEWGIILLALLLAAAGVWCLRKSQLTP